MLDSAGTIHPLSPQFFKDIPVVENSFTGRAIHEQGRPLREAIQKACDSIEPDRSKQGPVFIQDEVVELKGRKFLITKIDPGHLRLKSLPAD